MPTISTTHSIDISPLKFLRACTDVELQEINLLLNNAEFVNRLQPQTGQTELPEAMEIDSALMNIVRSNNFIHFLLTNNIPELRTAYAHYLPELDKIDIYCHLKSGVVGIMQEIQINEISSYSNDALVLVVKYELNKKGVE